jgi:hypothetical protein
VDEDGEEEHRLHLRFVSKHPTLTRYPSSRQPQQLSEHRTREATTNALHFRSNHDVVPPRPLDLRIDKLIGKGTWSEY